MSLLSIGRAAAERLRGSTPTSQAIAVPLPRDLPVTVPATLLGALALAAGCASLAVVSLEPMVAPLLTLVALSQVGLAFHARACKGEWDLSPVVLCVLAACGALALRSLPEYFWGYQINAVVHRSIVSALVLIGVGLPALCASLFYLLGGTPAAEDVSRYPLIILPAAAGLAAYALLFGRLIADGLGGMDWQVISRPFQYLQWQEKVYVQGWPTFIQRAAKQSGMSNHILGTLMIMGLTSAIALPVGVGTGLLISEYTKGWVARTISTAVSALRAMSAFIIGLAALTAVKGSAGSALSDFVAGFYTDQNGNDYAARGSFLLAALFLSVLVIPIIARATEEGCRSMPASLREGSVALGASDGFTLRRLILPWCLPNIVTGLLLGCAEAAGNVTVLMFLAGNGQYGVGLFSGVTSLSYLIFDAKFGVKPFTDLMRPYQFSAAVILVLMTVGLSLGGLLMRRWANSRYHGLRSV